ncbi:MAG: histidinol-phosphate transaminase [Ignavibacteria bacterium GWF2_33_9]|nr:MAG: histidinol-phosphate transaminase [Ignavibacteria bacterium GWF2_33_9]
MFTVPKHIEDLKSYDPGKPIDDVMLEYGLKYVVKLASNENPLGVSPQAIQAMMSSIYQYNRYPDIASKILCSRLSEIYNLEAANIITGHGSEAILSVIIRTYLKDDDEVLTSEGTFVGFYVICNARGIKPIQIPLKDYRFDLEAIANAITNKTKIIYLVNPNNPTGNIFTKTEFETFIKKVPENVLVIMDEAYHEFVSGHPDYPDSMHYRYDNIITLRTFSKAYGLAGIRLGYGFAQKGVIKNLMKVRLPFEPGIPSQMAGVAALNDSMFLDYYLKINLAGLNYLYGIFEKHGIRYIKSDANFVCSVFDSAETVDLIVSKLLTKGVIVRGLRAFGLPHCLRVSVGLQSENEFFASKFDEVLNEINFKKV